MAVEFLWGGFHVAGQATTLLSDLAKPIDRLFCDISHCLGNGLARKFLGLWYPVRKVMLTFSILVVVIAKAVGAQAQGLANAGGCA
ncbi:hypothetical protein FQZ97_991770 [compost metagenome]